MSNNIYDEKGNIINSNGTVVQAAGDANQTENAASTGNLTTGNNTTNANSTQTTDNVGKNNDINNVLSTKYQKYKDTKQVYWTQTDPHNIKTINFKQDYVVIIRKKLYYMATAQQSAEGDPEENYLRAYQINNFVNLNTNLTINGGPGSCNLTIHGGERVVCAEKAQQQNIGWSSWKALLNNWKDIGGTASSVKDSQGINYKNVLKANEAKYGWRYAEKCDWEPMDEILVFGKSKNPALREKSSGQYQFKQIFFGYIDSVTKSYTAGKAGLVISIKARDHTKLLQISRITNSPSFTPGLSTGNGGLDFVLSKSSKYGEFPLMLLTNPNLLDELSVKKKNGTATQQELRYYDMLCTAFTNKSIFAGIPPYKIIHDLCSDAGIPDKYIDDRIERVEKVPFLNKLKNLSSEMLFSGDLKDRYSYCSEAAVKLYMEFFADEEGRIVFKIPSYALGANKLKANNMDLEEIEKVGKINKVLVDEDNNILKKSGDSNSTLSDEEKSKQGAASSITGRTAKQVSTDSNSQGSTPLNTTEKTQTSSTPVKYTVNSGDTLYSISEKINGTGDRWKEIHNDNYNIIGSDPNNIQTGSILTINSERPSTQDVVNEQVANSASNANGTWQYRYEDGSWLSKKTDQYIKEIPPEHIISFSLKDTDEQVYNMYEVAMEYNLVEMQSISQVRAAVPDLPSIVRFGMRPHPSTVNTPLISNPDQARIFGVMLCAISLAKRYSGTLNLIEDSDIRVGDPIRVHLYDEHPYQKTGQFKHEAQAVFYVFGIDRSINMHGVSTMTLHLQAGRMMGMQSIFDLSLPIYQTFYETGEVDTSSLLYIYQNKYGSNYRTIEIDTGFTMSTIISTYFPEVKNDTKMIGETYKAIAALNQDLFDNFTLDQNVMDSMLIGQGARKIKIPNSILDLSQYN